MAAAATSQQTILLTAFAGLVAGAMSMAAGEYVSVSSQADSEKAERAKEAWELEHQPKAERIELISIYKNRGLTADLAEQVLAALLSGQMLIWVVSGAALALLAALGATGAILGGAPIGRPVIRVTFWGAAAMAATAAIGSIFGAAVA